MFRFQLSDYRFQFWLRIYEPTNWLRTYEQSARQRETVTVTVIARQSLFSTSSNSIFFERAQRVEKVSVMFRSLTESFLCPCLCPQFLTRRHFHDVILRSDARMCIPSGVLTSLTPAAVLPFCFPLISCSAAGSYKKRTMDDSTTIPRVVLLPSSVLNLARYGVTELDS